MGERYKVELTELSGINLFSMFSKSDMSGKAPEMLFYLCSKPFTLRLIPYTLIPCP